MLNVDSEKVRNQIPSQTWQLAQHKPVTIMPSCFFFFGGGCRSTVPWATSYLLCLDAFLPSSVKEKTLSRNAQEPDSKLELCSGHIRSKRPMKAEDAAPLPTSPFGPHSEFNVPHTWPSSSIFSLNTQAPLQSVGFSSLSPGHPTLIFFSLSQQLPIANSF